MHPLTALLLLTSAGAPPAAPLPDRAEAAMARFEQQADICRALIDVCEGSPGTPSPESVTGLSCRAGRPGHASCRFTVAGERCRAEFVSAAAGGDHAWALDWSQLPAPSGQRWAVAWTRSPAPRGPRIWCV